MLLLITKPLAAGRINMNQTAYTNRIGYSGELEPTLNLLQKLQKSHLMSIPFENLDIHWGIPIELNINRIFQKIVVNNRGGYCYELNGLFYKLLTSIGFKTKRISARVYDKNKEYGQEYDHMATVVSLNGIDYLTDVGFGEFAFGPLRLELDKIQNDETGDFVIEKFDQDYIRVSKIEDGELQPEYIFKNVHREFDEFEDMCNYHQTNPESHFTQKKLISIPTENGRITLTDDKLKIRANNSIEETDLKNKTEFDKELWNYFKIRTERKPAANKL